MKGKLLIPFLSTDLYFCNSLFHTLIRYISLRISSILKKVILSCDSVVFGLILQEILCYFFVGGNPLKST